MEGTTPPIGGGNHGSGTVVTIPSPTSQEIKMVTEKGILTVEMLPAVMKEFKKELNVAGLQATTGTETKKGYDTLGYGYAWVSERLNDVVPFCWRLVTEDTETISDHKSANGNTMYTVGIEVVIQLGNWKNFEKITTEAVAAGTVEAKKGYTRDFEVLAESPIGHGWHRALNLADARKGALTNGFKKAAGFFGIGNEAYKKAIDEENQEVKDALNKKKAKKTPGKSVNTVTIPGKPSNNLALIKRKLNEMGAKTEPEVIRMLSDKYSFDCDSLDGLSEKQQKLLVQRILYPQQNNA